MLFLRLLNDEVNNQNFVILHHEKEYIISIYSYYF